MPRSKLRKCRRCCRNCWSGPRGFGLRWTPEVPPAAPQRPSACWRSTRNTRCVAGTLGPFRSSHLLSALSLTVVPTLGWGLSLLPASAFLLIHPTLSAVSPSHGASSRPEGPRLWHLSPALLQAELDSRTDSISLVRTMGQQLLAAGHPSIPNIREALAGLDQELNSLEGAWQEHQLQLQQALELQVGSLHPAPMH